MPGSRVGQDDGRQALKLDQLMAQKRIILTMGPGGVGKTTVAAALGLQAAVSGRRALVLTLDPAMRLAEAMGLGGVEAGQRNELSIELLHASGISAKQALTVEMLDTHKAWTNTIAREVKDPSLRKKIIDHPFFDRMSHDLAGAREYAAMEELYHLYLRGEYDLVILDTPPTVHGMDFLEAPDKVLDVLEHDAYRWLMRPALLAGKMGLRMLNFSGGYVTKTLARFTGMEFLRDLAGFVDLFSGLLEGFRQRASVVRATLRSDVTSFVLVTAAQKGSIEEAVTLYRRLKNHKMAPDALLVNRFTFPPEKVVSGSWCHDELIQIAGTSGVSQKRANQIADALVWSYQALDKLSRRDRSALDSLKKQVPNCCQPMTIAMMDGDIHDLSGLEKLRLAIFESSDKRKEK